MHGSGYKWLYIGKRLLICPLILWLIYTITFLMAIAIPGNPFKMGQRSLNPDLERAVLAQYHADDNWLFYREYLSHLFQPIKAMRGEGPLIDLGPSWQYRDWSCNQIIGSALPVSVALGLMAVFLAVVVGVTVGVISAVKRGSWFDYSSLGLVFVGISLPSFVIGTALLILFTVKFTLLPVGGWGRFSQLWLPVITLSLPFMAYIARLTRLGMLDVIDSDYIRTAHAKGLGPGQVIIRHGLKNAFLPVLSYLGPAAAAALTGSFVVESIFDIPGLGRHFVAGVLNRDRALILGTVLVYSAVIILFNLLVDITYTLVDPRIDLEKQ